ncbi:cellobiohydrolase A [Microbacterium testaceum StLB037]|uniref:Glucanase n=1 Tax=Microbacterium testaceum (strain StLB037) TaxID=979556 RepID=E8NEI3_MICTS|nr:cellobiohydrolase A [Microbacterium testaceum StLB037]
MGAVVVVVALIAGIAVVGSLVSSLFQTLGARPPAVDTKIVAPDESKAAIAANDPSATPEQAAAAKWLAAQPTTYWLTPEIDPVDEIWDRIAHLASEARDQDASLSVAVYGLPDRDCGNHSAGGLDPDSYREWTKRIGDALRNAPDIQKIVILEPDSIALSSSCGSPSDRAGYLRTAVENIRGTNTWIYLDGGHSAWHPVDEMASLISSTGLIGDVQGHRAQRVELSGHGRRVRLRPRAFREARRNARRHRHVSQRCGPGGIGMVQPSGSARGPRRGLLRRRGGRHHALDQTGRRERRRVQWRTPRGHLVARSRGRTHTREPLTHAAPTTATPPGGARKCVKMWLGPCDRRVSGENAGTFPCEPEEWVR